MLTDEELLNAYLMEHFEYGYNTGIQDGISCGILFLAFLILVICIWFLFWRKKR